MDKRLEGVRKSNTGDEGKYGSREWERYWVYHGVKLHTKLQYILSTVSNMSV